jgi:tetratricopeptide (TPR) repeat protein
MTRRYAASVVLLSASWICAASWVVAQEPQVKSLWEMGQAAMKRGDTAGAIDLYRRCLKQDPAYSRAHLSLAAAYLEQGDERLALPHLATYVRAVPEHALIRVHYAEILFRLQLFQESRAQFEEFIALVQDRADVSPALLIEVHSKLMDIADATDDDYAERLHRGIGLYLLACERLRLANPDGKLSVEGLLCRAVDELKDAAALRSQEARPELYLYLVWTHLGQRPQADRALRHADNLAAFSYLTPFEAQQLEFARRKMSDASLMRDTIAK